MKNKILYRYLNLKDIYSFIHFLLIKLYNFIIILKKNYDLSLKYILELLSKLDINI